MHMPAGRISRTNRTNRVERQVACSHLSRGGLVAALASLATAASALAQTAQLHAAGLDVRRNPLRPLWFALVGREDSTSAIAAALALTLTAAVARIASLARYKNLKPLSTPQSAIGVKAAKLKQMSQGATGGSFNTREFFHGKSALVVRNVRWIALGLAFALPAALLFAATKTPAFWLLATAVVSQLLGLLAERWLFFAQANHPQNIYYQAVA